MADSRGFTIIELMIALSILSVILVMSTLILIQITSLYTKGVNSANLQNTSRNIVADVSSSLQFSGFRPDPGTLNGPGLSPNLQNSTTYYATSSNPVNYPNPHLYNGDTVYAFCFGIVRYSYILDSELGTDQVTTPATVTNHVLWRDNIKQGSRCTPLDISQSEVLTDKSSAGQVPNVRSLGYEMVGNHMRLTRLMIYPDATVNNVYSIDVWMAYGDSDLVLNSSLQPQLFNPANGLNGHSVCSGAAGTEYCGVSELSTVITGRVYN